MLARPSTCYWGSSSKRRNSSRTARLPLAILAPGQKCLNMRVQDCGFEDDSVYRVALSHSVSVLGILFAYVEYFALACVELDLPVVGPIC